MVTGTPDPVNEVHPIGRVLSRGYFPSSTRAKSPRDIGGLTPPPASLAFSPAALILQWPDQRRRVSDDRVLST